MNDLVSGCANHTSGGGGGGRIGTLPRLSRAEAMEFVTEALTHAHNTHNTRIAHNARFSSADRGGDETWNIATCRDIPNDRVIDGTSDNTRVGMTESSFGKSCQRPSNDLMNVRNIPSTVIANIPMNGDISSGCCRDGSDNVMTNSMAHCTMGVSQENAVILPSRQATGNQLMDQVKMDPIMQIKVINTYAQGSRDGPGGVVGDIIAPQANRTSESTRVALQQPSTVPSFHAQCSNVGCRNDTPSQMDRAGKLQAVKVLERAAPKIKFTGKNNEMNFERFMERIQKE
jgi:hypothetical protein